MAKDKQDGQAEPKAGPRAPFKHDEGRPGGAIRTANGQLVDANGNPIAE